MNIPSPFRPQNPTPPVLAGRDAGLRWFNDDLRQIAEHGQTNSPAHVIVGQERMGKSSLLHGFAQAAEAANFAVFRAVALPGANVASLVSQEIAFTRPKARSRITALTGGAMGFFGSIAREPAPKRDAADDFALRQYLAEETAKVGKKHAGVVILVDAAHDADPASFHALADAIQRNRDSKADHGAAVLLVVAGDQRLEPQLNSAGAGGPFKWHSLGRLNRESTMRALSDPAMHAGVSWDPGALQSAAELTQGYPQWIQAYGDAIWHNSPGTHITMDAVHRGAQSLGPTLVREVEQLWERTDSLDRDVMKQVAQVGGTRNVSDLAQDLQLSLADTRSLVNRSLRNESLHSLGQDTVTLPRPYMSNWILTTQRPQAEVAEEIHSIAEYREARAAVLAGRTTTPPTISPDPEPSGPAPSPPAPGPTAPDPEPSAGQPWSPGRFGL